MKTIYKIEENVLMKRIRLLLWFFIGALLISGITAFPLEFELEIVNSILSKSSFANSEFGLFINKVYRALREINLKYPFISYGTDWLAFAHIMIAVAFIGPLKDPVRNIWIVYFGIIACIGIIPLAFIAGGLREIPIYWRLIDCSFGVFGIIPLLLCVKYIKRVEGIDKNEDHLYINYHDINEAKIYDF